MSNVEPAMKQTGSPGWDGAPPKIHLQTFGCQMNEYDSELVTTILKRKGCEFAASEDDAEVFLFNTCAIRETAHNRIYARLDALKTIKRKRPGLVVGVLGCMAPNLKEELLLRFPAVDFICGPDSYREVPALIQRSRTLHDRGTEVELSEYETYEDILPTRVEGVNGWIAIMRGCDNFCTFCVVPYTRGRERSRDPKGVVQETKQLVSLGYKQVTLLGQNVNSYRHEGSDFADLMKAVGQVPGIERVRFTSPHPMDFPTKLLGVIAENPTLCSQIHLPLQSGNDRILKKMNRNYRKDEFLDLVSSIRETIPGVSLSTDIICGFPTETEEEYEDTVDVVNQVRFDSAYIFKYSERKGTVAKKLWADDVSEEAKSRRVTDLVRRQKEISLENHRSQIGSVQRVLIEGTSRKDDREWRSRSEANTIVVFADPEARVGDFRQVKIVGATPNTLLAELT